MAPRPEERLIFDHCRICKRQNSKTLWDCGSYRFTRCKNCGHIYQYPRPSEQDLDLRYSDSYFDYELTNAEGFLTLMLQGLEDVDIDAVMKERPHSSHILDIGCATGALLEHYKNLGWKAQGIELCAEAADYATRIRNVPVVVGSAEKVDLPNGRFDLIHCAHVIEHVINPEKLLRNIARWLSPNGVAVIVTPNTTSFQAYLMQKRWRSAIADHLNLFSAKNLTRLARDCGLSLLRKCSWGGIGKGIAPNWIKYPMDRLAKHCNIGDVMLLAFTRQ